MLKQLMHQSREISTPVTAKYNMKQCWVGLCDATLIQTLGRLHITAHCTGHCNARPAVPRTVNPHHTLQALGHRHITALALAIATPGRPCNTPCTSNCTCCTLDHQVSPQTRVTATDHHTGHLALAPFRAGPTPNPLPPTPNMPHLPIGIQGLRRSPPCITLSQKPAGEAHTSCCAAWAVQVDTET